MWTPLTTFAILISTAAPAAQADWTQITPATLPPARTNQGMCSDVVSLWMFGGSHSARVPLNDTWRYIAGNWQQLKPTTSPPARLGGKLVYDTTRSRVVLFGGRVPSSSFFNDTWEYVGNDWTQVNTTTSPPALFRFQMVYDAKRKHTMLFGGRDASKTDYGDTWTYDGVNWTKRSPATSPSPRMQFAMCYNSDTGETLLIGGMPPINNETWKWDGSTWTQLNPTTSPPPTRNMNMAYDASRKRFVLFGGFAGSRVDTTWEFDGTSWVQRSPSNKPSARVAAPVEYLEIEQKVFLFGGYSPKYLGDFWSYATDKPARYTARGAGCAGTAGTPSLTATKPWIHDTFTVTVTNLPAGAPTFLYLGLSDKQWGVISLPLDLRILGAPTCSLYIDSLFNLAMANTGGTATFSAPIPNQAVFAGITFFNQAYAADKGANAAGLVVSNYGEGLSGIR